MTVADIVVVAKLTPMIVLEYMRYSGLRISAELVTAVVRTHSQG